MCGLYLSFISISFQAIGYNGYKGSGSEVRNAVRSDYRRSGDTQQSR